MTTYSIGDQVWYATAEITGNRVTCPDCFGKKFLTVILGDDSRVTVNCTGCEAGYEGSKGSIVSYDYKAVVQLSRVNAIEVESDGVRYGLESCYRIAERDMFSSKFAAEVRAAELVKEHERAEKKRLAGKEKDTRSWAWNATYHRGCIKRAERELEYHRAKLDMALTHKKEGKS